MFFGPDFYHFPPFFTIQPTLSTREKQLGQWRELLLQYHTQLKIKTLIIHECPLWHNVAINRQLSTDEIHIVITDFVNSGHGEYEDINTKTRIRIIWRRPEQLASDIYDWATTNGYLNSICTLYELHSGEDVHAMSFQGVDEELLRRALGVLEGMGKCAVFKGETSEEDGIKFF